MPNNWRSAYGDLKNFIDRNPAIEISINVIAIPADIRPEFYRLFNAVCISFGKEQFPDHLEKAYELSRKWGEVSQSLKDGLQLESIVLEDSVNWFLLDPADNLRRELFNSLFDLLKGKKDVATFEQTSISLLDDRFPKLSREGYRGWSMVSLLKLLSADKVYDIPQSDFDRDPSHHQEHRPGTREENAPLAEVTKTISFDHSHMYSFMVPKVIVHSTRLGDFAALGTDFEFNEARWRLRKLTQEKQWYSMSKIRKEFGWDNVWPDAALYTGDALQKLVVIADFFEMVQPEIILEFREEQNWYEKEGLEMVKRHYNALKPRLGSFVVCRESLPEAAVKELNELQIKSGIQQAPAGTLTETRAESAFNIHLLSVGYDANKLEPIIESIVKAKTG